MCLSAKEPRVAATKWYEPHVNDFRRQEFLRAQRLVFQAVEQKKMEKRRLEALKQRKAAFKTKMIKLIDKIIINNEEMNFFPNDFEDQFYFFLNWDDEFRHYNDERALSANE